jgi:hypothetical protein
VFRIDTFKSEKQFWTIGSVSASYSEGPEKAITKLNLKDKISLHSLGKLFTALRTMGTPDVEQILSNSLSCDAKANSSNSQALTTQFTPMTNLMMLLILQLKLKFLSHSPFAISPNSKTTIFEQLSP